MKRIVLAFLFFGTAASLASTSDERAQQRAVFEQAWKQAGRGDHAALNQAAAQLPDYPLTPYLRFESLRQNIDAVPADELEGFLDRHRDWSFVDRLEQQWLARLKADDHQALLLRHAGKARDAASRCRVAEARLSSDDREGLESEVRALWLNARSQPDACNRVFDWWRRQGNPRPEIAWQRFGMAVEAGEIGLARYLRRYLAAPDRMLADGWLNIAQRAASGLDDASDWPDQARARELIAWGLHRLAGSDWQRAQLLMQRFDGRFSFTASEIGPVRRRIALYQAVDLDPDAIAAIDSLAAEQRDQQMLEWRLRAALANELWQEVLDSVDQMALAQQLRERWRYWRARALAELGRPEAGLVYATLASEADYYGFLAALNTGQPLALCSRELPADGEIQQRLLRDAEFERALELYRVGLDWHARWTWNQVARRLSGSELRQAARLAAGIGWHDRAIIALGQAGATNAYAWRFPMVERERVARESSQHGVDVHLVMGLMRAESAMQVNALSPAGARGLLQLMDPTARLVAQRHGIEYSGAADLNRPERNIALGVAHLGELHRRFDGDWTLVAAAYNAGISNAERWRRQRPDLARDIWLETLPFFETRDYIPRILAFATIYEWLLDRSPRVLAETLL
ncbi:MAG: lytic transglycosylase domain-containing protein, partial [Xanthomonadaceae bacterium]|nr:lytic transglycosylase domain-containing protein [Xanthomonadaceae bacterium]